MKNIIALLVLVFSFSIIAGEGSSGGGPRTISANTRSASPIDGPLINLRDIQNIETIDRRIIFKEDIEIIFKVEGQKLILDERILNIEITNGEMINISR